MALQPGRRASGMPGGREGKREGPPPNWPVPTSASGCGPPAGDLCGCSGLSPRWRETYSPSCPGRDPLSKLNSPRFSSQPPLCMAVSEAPESQARRLKVIACSAGCSHAWRWEAATQPGPWPVTRRSPRGLRRAASNASPSAVGADRPLWWRFCRSQVTCQFIPVGGGGVGAFVSLAP